MTILAGSVCKWFVHLGFKKFRVRRGMRIMTFSAIHHAGIHIQVGRSKRSRFVIMAFPA